SVGDWERRQRGFQCGRLPESNCTPQRIHRKCKPEDNRWGRRSAWRRHPETCDRTSTVECHPNLNEVSRSDSFYLPQPKLVLLVLVNDVVNNPVFLALLRVHDEVALDVFLYFIKSLPRVLGQKLIGNLAHPQNLSGMNVNIGGLP